MAVTNDDTGLTIAANSQLVQGPVTIQGGETFTTPLPVGSGGTGTDLSATGGANRFLKQSSAGAVVTVAALVAGDTPDGSLSANVALLGADPQTFTGATAFSNVAGIKERGRSVAMGAWSSVTYSAGNYTASAGNWTVSSGNVTTLKFTLVGKTMTIAWIISSTTVSATPATLRIAIPGGFTAAAPASRGTFSYSQDGSTWAIGLSEANGSNIFLFRDGSATAWSTTTATTFVQGTLTLEVA